MIWKLEGGIERTFSIIVYFIVIFVIRINFMKNHRKKAKKSVIMIDKVALEII